MQSEYARLAGISPAALTAAMEPYLPIIHVRFLLGRAANPALRERLLQQVEAALRSEDQGWQATTGFSYVDIPPRLHGRMWSKTNHMA